MSALFKTRSLKPAIALYFFCGLLSFCIVELLFFFSGVLDRSSPWTLLAKTTVCIAISTVIVSILLSRQERATNRTLELLKAILDGTPDVIFVKDREGRYLLMNEAGARIAGKEVEQILGNDVTALFDDPGSRLVADQDRRMLESGTATTTEVPLRVSGATRTFQTTRAPYRNESGAVIGIVGISRDVTEQRAEAERLQLFRALIDQVPATIEVIEPDTGKYLDVNESACRTHGYSREEYIARGVSHIDPTVRGARWSAMLSELEPGKALVVESVHSRQDGSTFPVEIKLTRVTFGAGFVVAIVRDITDQKRVERSLRESEARFVGFMQHMPGLAWIKDVNGRYLFANEATQNAFGLTLDKMLGHEDGDLLPRETAEVFRANDRHVLGTRSAVHVVERLVHPDGRVRLSYVSKFPIPDPDTGELVLGGVAVDITERIEAEESLRKSQERLKVVIDAEPECVKVVAPDGTLLEINPAGLQMIEADSLARVAGQCVFDLIALEDRDRFRAMHESVCRGRSETLQFQVIGLHGAHRWVETHAAPIRLDGEGYSHLAITRDITERKRNEELIASQLEIAERLRLIVDSSYDAIISNDLNGLIRTWNAAAERIFGYTANEMIGKPVTLLMPSDRVDEEDIILEKLRSGERIENFETIRVHKDGRFLDVSVTISPVRDPSGKLVGASKVVRDITKSKRIEIHLRESEARRSAIFETSIDAIVVIDHHSQVIDFNPAAERTFGYAREQVIGRDMADLIVPPAFREPHRRGMERFLATGEKHVLGQRIELMAIRSDGSEFPCEIAIDAVTNSRFPMFVGILRDISKRKLSEQELFRTTELLKAVVDGTTDAVFVKDLEGKYLLFNEAAAGFVGKSVEEVLGRDDTALFDPPSAVFLMERDRRTMASGLVETEEETITAVTGITRTFQATKGPYRDHEGRVAGVIGVVRDVTERKQIETDLWLRDRAIRAVPQGLMITDATKFDNPIIYVSPGFERLTGYTATEAIGRNGRFLQGKDSDPEAVTRLREAIREGREITVELWNYRKDGTRFWNQMSVSPIRNEKGEIIHFVGVQNDGTSRRQLEDQLRQSQKMEAIGQLAGGVAHDFNNLLTVINGYTDLVLDEMPAESSNREQLSQVREAGDRAAGLTSQLLAFSRKTIVTPRLLDLNELIDHLCKLLRRLIGEDIVLETVLDTKLSRVKADPAHMEQAIINLAINARDAMPRGGRLRLETSEVRLENHELPSPNMEAGKFVRLAVADNGHGMSREIIDRIFEPFFTTKEVGQGTGLGLAMVHGIVSQAGGHIGVDSEEGRGTTFAILFPAVTAEERFAEKITQARLAPRGTETVLLVEDEEGVRRFAQIVLEMQGYKVLTAASGPDALRVLDLDSDSDPGNHHRVDLIVTDVIMPEMGGRELAESVLARHPTVRVLYMSGYTEDAILRYGIESAKSAFIQKPFTPLGLARKIREVLDQQ